MSWSAIFDVFVVSHLFGDFLLQTNWQAINKFGGLPGGGGEPRALLAHVATYTLAFVPALIWLTGSLGAGILWVAALIAVPHIVQDDGRLLERWIRDVKHSQDIKHGGWLFTAIDQSFHLVLLFAVAVLAGH